MINFNLNTSKNYQLVQRQLCDLIQEHLLSEQYTESMRCRVENSLNFSLFLREEAEVVMSHGVADKNYFWMRNQTTGERYVNKLKAVFVPGEWMRRKMLNSSHIFLKEELIVPVGWPRLDLLRSMQDQVIVPQPTEKLKILWAPTHDKRKRGAEKKSTSSYPEFEMFAEKLAENHEIQYSLHPRNRKQKEPTLDKLLHSNVVVSDFGTMVYEAWALDKPVIFPRWILGDSIQTYLPNSAEAYIFSNKIGYHPESYNEFLDILESGPVIEEDVKAFMKDYLLNYNTGCSSKIVADSLLRLC